MKKIAFIGIPVAIAMGFTACQKENLANEPQLGNLVTETFSAGFAQKDTKTTVSDDAKTVTWAANDQIHYYTKDGGTVRDFTIATAGSSATLTLEREEGDTYYNLVYTGTTAPTFTTKTSTSMIFDGVKSEQDGTFQNANISVANTTPGGSGITFRPVVPLVKFTTARTDIKTIVLTGGNGEKVAGNILVDPTADEPVASLSGTGEHSITVTIATPAAGTYYIGVIPHNYPNGLKMTLKNSSGGYIGTVTASKSTDLCAGDAMINYGDVDTHINTTTVLDGRFSVGASKQVQFTRGNLYWDGSAWKLEANQSDCPTTRNSNHVGHLYWTKDAANSYAETYSDGTCTTSDIPFFGESNGGLTVESTSGLFALSKDEWVYLLNISSATTGARQDANRFAKAQVNGKNGLVIFPDGYNGGVTISGITGLATINNTSEGFPTSSIADATWSSMESAGCVFLPIAGYWENSKINYPSAWGCYWSSTPNNSYTQAYSLNIGGSQINPNNNGKRLSGLSIRLVKDCTPTYTEGTYTGKAVRINGTWWAPVNCGYDASHTYGLLYQWGRTAGCGYSATEGMQTSTDAVYYDGYNKSPDDDKIYIVRNVAPNDWYTNLNDASKQLPAWPMNSGDNGYVKGKIGNPCPAGWRVPTSTELYSLTGGKDLGQTGYTYDAWDSTNKGFWFNGTTTPAKNDGLFLPAAGYYHAGEYEKWKDYSPRNRDEIGYYWSSSVSSGTTKASQRYLAPSKTIIDMAARAHALSIRCVQE